MMRPSTLALLGAGLLLAACSEQPDAAGNAADGAHSVSDHRQAGDPFAAGEQRMHQQMAAAVGVDPADTWVRKMIAHHEGAVDMSRIVLGLSPSPEVRRLAETTVERQGREIEELKAMVRPGTPDPASAELYRSVDEAMHRDMMAAKGATSNDLWIAKMIAHHRGAVDMSRLVLTRNPPADVRWMAEVTIADQSREIAELEGLLGQSAATR